MQAVERAQERILADVLGLLGADDPRRHSHDDGPVAVDELLERASSPRVVRWTSSASSISCVVDEGGFALTTRLTAGPAPGYIICTR